MRNTLLLTMLIALFVSCGTSPSAPDASDDHADVAESQLLPDPDGETSEGVDARVAIVEGEPEPYQSVDLEPSSVQGADEQSRPARILGIAEVPEIATYRDLNKLSSEEGMFREWTEIEGAYVREPEALHVVMGVEYNEIEIIWVNGRGWMKSSGRWQWADASMAPVFGEFPANMASVGLNDLIEELTFDGRSIVNGIEATRFRMGPNLLARIFSDYVGAGVQGRSDSAEGEISIANSGYIVAYDVHFDYTVDGEPAQFKMEYEVFDVNAEIEITPPGPFAEDDSDLGGLIAFTREGDGPADIYVMRPDGTDLTRITSSSSNDAFPAWSPDGRKIAFVSDRDGQPDLYMLSYPDGAISRLTDTPGFEMRSSWSPDAKRIAFTSSQDGDSEIYVLEIETGAVDRITDNSWWDGLPDWCPDGQRIVYASQQNDNVDIYVVPSDGGHESRLTRDEAFDSFPSWSPDGTRIAFISDRHSGTEVYVMNDAGGDVERLIWSIGDDSYPPTWSPDGRSIMFSSARDGNWELYLMDRNGEHQIKMTADPAQDRWVSWSPASVVDIPSFYPPD